MKPGSILKVHLFDNNGVISTQIRVIFFHLFYWEDMFLNISSELDNLIKGRKKVYKMKYLCPYMYLGTNTWKVNPFV